MRTHALWGSPKTPLSKRCLTESPSWNTVPTGLGAAPSGLSLDHGAQGHAGALETCRVGVGRGIHGAHMRNRPRASERIKALTGAFTRTEINLVRAMMPAPGDAFSRAYGGAPQVTVAIASPLDNAAVVGPAGGVIVEVTGTLTVTLGNPVIGIYTFPWPLVVTVKFGPDGSPGKATIAGSTQSSDFMLNWQYIGTLPTGGAPIQLLVHAQVGWSWDPGDGSERITGWVDKDAAARTLAIATVRLQLREPQDGEVFVGSPSGLSITASGTADASTGGGIYEFLWGIDSDPNQQLLPFVSPFSFQMQVPLGYHTLKFKALDHDGNSLMQVITVQIALPEDVLAVDSSSYLKALVEFATAPFSNTTARVTTDSSQQQNLTLDLIDKTFHQSIADILDPINSAKANETVNSTRISIEVLRRYLSAHPPWPEQAQTPQALATKESEYRAAAYQSLLAQIGTSYDEIRLARTYDRNSPADRKQVDSIADRLGLQIGAAKPDEVDRLFFDAGAGPGTASALSESALEQVFGLVDTTRDAFSQGPTIGDVKGQVIRWHLDGLNLLNTDQDGLVYLTLKHVPSQAFLATVSSDSLGFFALAEGSSLSGQGVVVLEQATNSNSGVSGLITINYQADTTTPIALSVFPHLLSWQRNRLRADWVYDSSLLSQGPVVADPMEQITRWSLSGFGLSNHTDANGLVYVALTRVDDRRGPTYEVDIYSDQARKQLIATGKAPSPIGTVALAEANASGVSGSMTLNYKADTSAIALSFKPSTPPAVDPDLLTDADFTDFGNPAHSLYRARKTLLTTWYTNLKTQREGAATPFDGLNAILSSVLNDAQYFPTGMSIDNIRTLDNDRQNGADISATLTALALDASAFNYLVRICPLVIGAPLLDREWGDIYSILVQVQKRRAEFAWVVEEQQKEVTLGPDYFTVHALSPPPFATGVDANGLPLDDGAIDPHWSIASTPSGARGPAYATDTPAAKSYVDLYWMRNSSRSRWISPQADEGLPEPGGYYKYRTLLDLGGFDPSSVWLIARVAVDYELTGVRVNDLTVGSRSALGPGAFQTLEIDGVFQSGINTLDFVVNNPSGPCGLRVELSFGAPPVLSSLPAWRATPTARHNWETRLQGRIDQDAALAADLQSAVATTEQQTLRGLRDAMLAAVSTRAEIDSLHSTGSQPLFDTSTGWTFDYYWSIDHASQSNWAYIAWPPNPAWLPDDLLSSWIAPSGVENSGPGDPTGDYIYRTNFDLRTVDLNSVQINLRVAVDNTITNIFINGRPLGLSASGFSTLTPLTIATGFAFGANRLEIVVNNAGTSPNPSGLRVQVDSSEVVFVDADWVSSALLIDVKETSHQRTTRLQKATEMMQGLFFALRNYEFTQLSPGADSTPWTLIEMSYLFDEEWETMGSYVNWKAAMLAFLYPENLLFPTLRLVAATPTHEPQAPWEGTKQFGDLAAALTEATPLTAPGALQIANTYVHDLNSVKYPNLPVDLKVRQDQDWYQDPREADAASVAASRRSMIIGYLDTSEWTQLAFIWEACYSVPIQIALELQKSQQFQVALAWFGIVYAYYLPLVQVFRPSEGWVAHWADDQRQIFPLSLLESNQNQYLQVPTWTVNAANPHQVAVTRAYPYKRFVILLIIECLLDYADAQFTSETIESISNAVSLYEYALELLSQLEAKWPAVLELKPNPRLRALRVHAENNLAKLRAGRNIAGMLARSLDNGSTTSTSLQPSAYRYAALVDRATQITLLAQQVEGSYLASLQKSEDEAYSALRARQDLESANGAIRLETLKMNEATDSVGLAQDQCHRARVQMNHYSDLMSSDILVLEGLAVFMQSEAAIASTVASVATLQIGSAISSAASGAASALNATASIEEKQMDWQAQLDLATQDLMIGLDQVLIAKDSVMIASQDLVNANTQADHASATATFLANKFTNADLYRWMSGVLGGVYSYLLRQATAIARVAEAQLAFERQEKPLSLIQPDYWRALTGPTDQTTDRRGLTGSERLLADITQLEQYALDTDRRRLQLTKVISLSRLDPIAFARFLQSGVLRFATPMSAFDTDFPGHYVRMIKQVRVSVVALIPPTQGIRATLANAGVSRVITLDEAGSFTQVIVRRDPQSIALSSPTNATGLFDLTFQSGMLLPFEDLGVDTSWEFVMPRAANPFDFNTIADIQLAIDYTALGSPDYRQQVIQKLNSSVSADRAYSFRNEFADAWYSLNNSKQSPTPMCVQFETIAADFPPNVDPTSLTIGQVVTYFKPADGAKFPVTATLSFSGVDASGNPRATSGQATSTGQIISTRRGASAWKPLIGMGVVGSWTLDLSNPDMSSLFQSGQIQDIVFVITYLGLAPAWPA